MALVYRNSTSFSGPISTITRLRSGDLVVAFREALWRGMSTHADPTTKTSLIRSSDNGETWHTQVTPDPAAGNGASVSQLSDGTLIVSNFRWAFAPLSQAEGYSRRPGFRRMDELGLAGWNEGAYTTRSRDDGYTWTPAARMFPASPGTSTAGKVVELDDGSLLAPMCNGASGAGSQGCWVAHSADRGDTWSFLAHVAKNRDGLGFTEMRLLPMPSGRLLASMRTQQANFYLSYSDDGGRSWVPPRDTEIWCHGSSPFDMLLLRDGRVLATYAHRRPPFGVRACVSEDSGQTWGVADETVLRDDGLDRDMGYPSSEQLNDGSVLTVYYWHGEDQIRYLESTRWSSER